MKILVTGGLGFIGSNFINLHLKKYPNDFIVNLDRNDYCSNIHNVNQCDNYKLFIGDICNKDLVLQILNDYNINIVYHFAAQSHVDNSFGNSLQFTIDNILGTHTLLECCHLYGKLIKFIHMSTDEVYGEVDINHKGCIEKSILNPTNPYFDNYSWWENPHLPNNKNQYQTEGCNGTLQYGHRNTNTVRNDGVLLPIVQPSAVLKLSPDALKLLF